MIASQTRTMDTLVEAILDSPLLPKHAERLNRTLSEESARRERFYREITENDKWEFINGEVIMHSPAKLRHSEVVISLASLLHPYVRLRNLGLVVVENSMVSLTRNDYEPDICFFRKEVADAFSADQMHFPAPDFIVEVLSPSTAHNDRGIKKRDYAAHGVAEYWIIDPVAKTVDLFILRGEDYESGGLRQGEDEVVSSAVPGFRIPARAFFDQKANAAALVALLTDSPVID